MKYSQLKEKLLAMFDQEKLQQALQEWGFFNEMEREIKSIGYATNITPEIIQTAGKQGIDMLLPYHDSWEFVYGLKEVCNDLLQEYGITHGFFHAPLDDADFGTSASLAKALGIRKEKVDMPYMDIFYAGVIGSIQPMTFEAFSAKLASVLNEDIRCFCNNDNPICKIAVATGGGNMTGDMQRAVANGCDTYITGEYVLYSQQYAKLHNMNLLVGSHTNTEILGVETMMRMLCENTDIKAIRIAEPNY